MGRETHRDVSHSTLYRANLNRVCAGLFASHIDYGADQVRSVDSVDIDPLTRYRRMADPIAYPMNELPLLATSSRSTAARACGPETLDIASRTIPHQGISASPRPRVQLPR